MIKINDEYLVTTFGINNYMKGIAKIDSLLVFIDGMYPNETAKIIITKVEKNLAYAKVKELIVKNPNRIDDVCDHSHDSGTCPMNNISYEYELELKKTIVLNNINRALNENINDIEIYSGNKIKGYRNKVTVFFNKLYEFGYFMENSNNFIRVDSCVQIDEKIEDIIKHLLMILKSKNAKMADFKNKDGIFKGVVIRKSEYTNEISVMILVTEDNENEYREISLELHKKYEDISSISFNINKSYDTFIYSGFEHQYFGTPYITEKIFNKTFKVNNMSFLQVNTSCASILYSEAIKMANLKKNETVLDLYSGCGGISLNASDYVKEVIGIETVKSATILARKNAIYNDVHNAKFYEADAKNFKNIINNKKIDCLFVDPPREGLNKKVIEDILSLDVKRIVYVSCDSYTLARDIKLLSKKYKINCLKCFNMFPRTKHVETVSVLSQK